jgi:hypothetical protein
MSVTQTSSDEDPVLLAPHIAAPGVASAVNALQLPRRISGECVRRRQQGC